MTTLNKTSIRALLNQIAESQVKKPAPVILEDDTKKEDDESQQPVAPAQDGQPEAIPPAPNVAPADAAPMPTSDVVVTQEPTADNNEISADDAAFQSTPTSDEVAADPTMGGAATLTPSAEAQPASTAEGGDASSTVTPTQVAGDVTSGIGSDAGEAVVVADPTNQAPVETPADDDSDEEAELKKKAQVDESTYQGHYGTGGIQNHSASPLYKQGFTHVVIGRPQEDGEQKLYHVLKRVGDGSAATPEFEDSDELYKHAHENGIIKPLSESDMKDAAISAELAFTGQTFEAQFKSQLLEGSEYAVDAIKFRAILESQELESDIAEQAVEAFVEAVNLATKAHIDKLSSYAAYVMEQLMVAKLDETDSVINTRLNEAIVLWSEDNKLAIEQGVRVKVAESFMDKFSAVLKEHFVEVPSFKADLYEENLVKLKTKNDELLESTSEIGSISEELKAVKKELFIANNISGMTALQKEKVKSLTDSLVYESDEDFAAKFSILKESITGNTQPQHTVSDTVSDISPMPITEESTQVNEYVGDPAIHALAKSLNRFKPK